MLVPGWDLSHAVPRVRRGVLYFLSLCPRRRRLHNFVTKPRGRRLWAAAVGVSTAATAQGLLTFFIQGLRRRAITEEDLHETGLTADEIRGRSFVEIMQRRVPR